MRISDWSSDVCSSDLFYGWTALCVVAGLPLLLGPRSGIYYLGRVWAHPILAALALLCGLRHEVRGRENVPAGAVLIAAKHQSAWDTIVFSILLWDHSFVLKRELLWAPLRSEEHTSELQSLMRISYAVFCLKKKNNTYQQQSL